LSVSERHTGIILCITHLALLSSRLALTVEVFRSRICRRRGERTSNISPT